MAFSLFPCLPPFLTGLCARMCVCMCVCVHACVHWVSKCVSATLSLGLILWLSAYPSPRLWVLPSGGVKSGRLAVFHSPSFASLSLFQLLLATSAPTSNLFLHKSPIFMIWLGKGWATALANDQGPLGKVRLCLLFPDPLHTKLMGISGQATLSCPQERTPMSLQSCSFPHITSHPCSNSTAAQ